ncbi:hypothetical protein EON62_01100, partial [archaeon]
MQHGTCSKYLCCWASRAQTRLLPNSRRPNYDDFNEMFWNRRVLRFTYHNLDADRGVQRIGYVPPPTPHPPERVYACMIMHPFC